MSLERVALPQGANLMELRHVVYTRPTGGSLALTVRLFARPITRDGQARIQVLHGDAVLAQEATLDAALTAAVAVLERQAR